MNIPEEQHIESGAAGQKSNAIFWVNIGFAVALALISLGHTTFATVGLPVGIETPVLAMPWSVGDAAVGEAIAL